MKITVQTIKKAQRSSGERGPRKVGFVLSFACYAFLRIFA
jgi:hypothetical protein